MKKRYLNIKYKLIFVSWSIHRNKMTDILRFYSATSTTGTKLTKGDDL